MIKIFNTSHTRPTMPGAYINITSTNIAVEHVSNICIFYSMLPYIMYSLRSFRYLIMKLSDGSDNDVINVIII